MKKKNYKGKKNNEDTEDTEEDTEDIEEDTEEDNNDKKGKKVEVCDKSLSFEDCELSILRMAVDESQKIVKVDTINDPEIKRMIKILENFLRRKQLVCYGGISINAILPKEDQFYDMATDLPDYDFFSTNSLEDAKELCDLYVKEGFIEVEGKSGIHEGTYKVFVNFIPIADVTFLPKELFDSIKRDAIKISGILYAPPNFLRMGMYKELSRPQGDSDRFEKVLKRMNLLNKHYPLSVK